MNFWFLWFLLIFLPLLVGIYLIWQKTGCLRAFGWFIVMMLAYYQLHWTSPWYVTQEGERVQEFRIKDSRFGRVVYVKWMQESNRLLILRNEDVLFKPEEYKYALVVDLESRQNQWQPIADLDMNATKKIKSLDNGYREQHDELSVYYASPSKKGPRVESSFVGFILPVLNYRIPFYSEISGWQWETTYFGWKHKVVREYESGPVLVKLNQIMLNDNDQQYTSASAWVMEGKFLIFEPAIHSGIRVFAFGPFNTSQTTQSTTNNKNQ